MASRKNKWRTRGRLQFRRETARLSDGTLEPHDVLYVRVRGKACAVVAPFDMQSYREQGKTVSVLCGTYRIVKPVAVPQLIRDYFSWKCA